MKKLLLTLLCAPLLMTGCLNSSDYEPPTMPEFTFNQLQFKGKMIATPLPGSKFAKFEQENVEFSILPPADPENQRVTLCLKNVRFVEQMPMAIECTYPNLLLMAWPYEQHLTASPADDKEPIYPYYQGLPLDIDRDGNPDEEYRTTNLLVDIVFAGDKITKGGVRFHCYTMAVEIVGDPIQ